MEARSAPDWRIHAHPSCPAARHRVGGPRRLHQQRHAHQGEARWQRHDRSEHSGQHERDEGDDAGHESAGPVRQSGQRSRPEAGGRAHGQGSSAGLGRTGQVGYLRGCQGSLRLRRHQPGASEPGPEPLRRHRQPVRGRGAVPGEPGEVHAEEGRRDVRPHGAVPGQAGARRPPGEHAARRPRHDRPDRAEHGQDHVRRLQGGHRPRSRRLDRQDQRRVRERLAPDAPRGRPHASLPGSGRR